MWLNVHGDEFVWDEFVGDELFGDEPPRIRITLGFRTPLLYVYYQ